MTAIDLTKLTRDQLKQVETQIREQKKAAKDHLKSQKEAYDSLKDEFVRNTFPMLRELSDKLKESKTVVYESAATLLPMKAEVHGLTPEELTKQKSHTFSTSDNGMSITIGGNDKDSWERDLCSAGIARVDAWIERRANGGGDILLGFVRDYLTPNGEGALDRAKIKSMKEKAEEFNEPELLAAAEMIDESYIAARSSTYIRAEFRDQYGVTRKLKLTMTE